MKVELTSGVVQGSIALTQRADVQCYLGVPFAASPVGEYRFKAPQPVVAWEHELDARQFGPAVPQNPDPFLTANDYFQPESSEDNCLSVNIWTPRADRNQRPVMVWIHGGAYVTGSNSKGLNNGAELAATFDVVIVSVNYRLGALGYLRLGHLLGGEYLDSGNLGVLDQIAALEWVRDNIGAFGGDPGSVTLFGESAGGAAVATLLGVRRAEGLFHRAIVQSGTAERARTPDQSESVTAAFLAAAGLAEDQAAQLLTMPVEDILTVQQRFSEKYAANVVGLPLPFQPTIDGDLLQELPLEAVRQGVNSTVELLVGTNKNEMALFTEHMSGTGDSLEETTSKLVKVADTSLPGARLDLERYLRTVADDLGYEPTPRQALEALLTDNLYRQPTNRLLDARASSRGKTYAYLFTWASPVFDGRLGACHMLDVPFVFRQLHRIEAVSLVGDHPPEKLSDWMSSIWVRFADTGRPASAALPKWKPYEPTERATMEFNLEPSLLTDPLGKLRQFWKDAALLELPPFLDSHVNPPPPWTRKSD